MDLINFIKEKTFKWYKSFIITIFIVNVKDDHDENFMFYFIYCLKSYIIKFLWNFVKKKKKKKNCQLQWKFYWQEK